MSKPKKTTKARTTRRPSQKAIEPPAGLVAAFAMVNPDGATPIAPGRIAQQTFPFAVQMLDLLYGRAHDGNQDVALSKVLRRATETIYADVLAEGEAEHLENESVHAEAAFNVGFAACWLLMTDVTGGRR